MTRLAPKRTFPFYRGGWAKSVTLALILCAINPQIGGVLISGLRPVPAKFYFGLVVVLPSCRHLDDAEQVP